MYGPLDYVRNLYVTTAMNTMEHQWLAKIFYSTEKIEKSLNISIFMKNVLFLILMINIGIMVGIFQDHY